MTTLIKLHELGDFDGNGVEPALLPEGTRGRLAQSWWAQRFLSAFEGAAAKPSLDHGRRYARKGQVLSLLVEPGEILARVQGTQPSPYICRLAGAAASDAQWTAILTRLVATSEYFSALLAAQMPPGLETLFAEVGASLFPESYGEVTCECTCDEGPMPCKHAVATACLFADRLDTEPGLLLQWRGRSQAEVVGALRRSWGATESLPEAEDRQETTLAEMRLERFYELSPAVNGLPPMEPATDYPDVMKRLGFPPFFPPGDRTVQQVLNNLYDES